MYGETSKKIYPCEETDTPIKKPYLEIVINELARIHEIANYVSVKTNYLSGSKDGSENIDDKSECTRVHSNVSEEILLKIEEINKILTKINDDLLRFV